VSTTEAPGRTLPFGSVTTPRMDVVLCAGAIVAETATEKSNNKFRHKRPLNITILRLHFALQRQIHEPAGRTAPAQQAFRKG
jgi:hypothetical protein